MICIHCFCADTGVLYGGMNVLVKRIITSPDPNKNYPSFSCCKCHEIAIPEDGIRPHEPNEDCLKRRQEYRRLAEEFLKQHGPMGC